MDVRQGDRKKKSDSPGKGVEGISYGVGMAGAAESVIDKLNQVMASLSLARSFSIGEISE